jgi:ubiquinone/menaquinone biosynthesis C-methylase UbiE
MSSPLATANSSLLRKKLINLHQITSHNHRIAILSKLIVESITSLKIKGPISIVDIGCGDMKMLYAIQALIPGAHIMGIDIYELPAALKEDSYWKVYQSFDGRTINLQNKAVDIALLIDVLHHLPQNEQLNLLREAGRVANYIIVKDHFEYSFFSRQMLRLMDFAGNWAYGVSVPSRYFSQKSFNTLQWEAGLTQLDLNRNIELYNHNRLLKYLLKSKWQFIYVGK